jgi:hypothetical protein
MGTSPIGEPPNLGAAIVRAGLSVEKGVERAGHIWLVRHIRAEWMGSAQRGCNNIDPKAAGHTFIIYEMGGTMVYRSKTRWCQVQGCTANHINHGVKRKF